MTANMTPIRIFGQAVIYIAFASLVWTFSHSPAYRPIPEDHAQIKLSFAHGGQPKGGCRDRTAEELAKLPANMRKKKLCPRERVPVLIVFHLNGKVVYQDSLPPTGIRKDGASRTYRKFVVPKGKHDVKFQLRDTERTTGFDYTATRQLDLKPGQNMAVDFDPIAGGFVFR